MIPRYQLPEMAEIWSDANRLKTMLRIEVLACEALAKDGRIPDTYFAAVAKIKPAQIDPQRVVELERNLRHETVAFVAHIEELVGAENARFLHFGLTSSDVLDTCFSVQLKSAVVLLIKKIRRLCESLQRRAEQHRMTLCAGRSHGAHAEPTTFGLKMAFAYAEMQRNLRRLITVRDEISTGALSGPVGTFAGLGPGVEAHVCERLGLRPEPISTQIIPRDRHAMYFAALALTASSLERLAIEIRSLQRTEILEIEESFSRDQKGSSAMPHKRNPILSENITGLARLIRSQVIAALENVALWHERDMSHSSVERVIAPDTTLALDFALQRMTSIIAGFTVHEERMKSNLDLTQGSQFSHTVLSALIEAGASRSDAYHWVQRCAASCRLGNGTFLDALQADTDVTTIISRDELPTLFNYDHFTEHVDTIFARVFTSSPAQ